MPQPAVTLAFLTDLTVSDGDGFSGWACCADFSGQPHVKH